MTEEQDKKIDAKLESELNESNENVNDLKTELEKERKRVKALETETESDHEIIESYEKKIQYLLADFENLKKRTESEIQNRVNSIVDKTMLKFLSIYDDFLRAKEALSKQKINIDGLDAILKNMDSFLSENSVIAIEAVGEIFDPELHEAISIIVDPSLDENSITAEIRKGYILQNRVIRPSLVEISKKSKTGEL